MECVRIGGGGGVFASTDSRAQVSKHDECAEASRDYVRRRAAAHERQLWRVALPHLRRRRHPSQL
jgi:hypothetical protein